MTIYETRPGVCRDVQECPGVNSGLQSKRTQTKTYPSQNVPKWSQNVPKWSQNVPIVKSKRTHVFFFSHLCKM